MSQVRVSGNASGTGILTVTSPNTNSNYTLTLPANTGTLLTTASTGTVLQVVMNAATGGSSTTSTTYVDVTNLTASITPSSASNKVLVIATTSGFASLVAGVNVLYYQQLLRTSTTLQEQFSGAASGSGGIQAYSPFAFSYLDSPATTSSTTYKIQHKVNTSSSTGSTTYGYIILMEIAG